MRIVGLFAGIGGIEVGFHNALPNVETIQVCEFWEPAQRVLKKRFPGAELHPDVRDFQTIPQNTDLLSAGFPCTDISQAGRTAGISGKQSGLVSHVFAALKRAQNKGENLPWLLIENVSNMLVLDGGEAMSYLVGELEKLGYRWAYRTVDSRFTGVPQRRRRVILLASKVHDPGQVLFADNAGEPDPEIYRTDAFGFYSTEGSRGLGWAQDAVPTIKGGSTVGIPSPPAIWIPGAIPGRKFLTPGIEDLEVMQGFSRGWTAPGGDGRRDADRWKMVGNAVTTGVASWVANRIENPGAIVCETREMGSRWAPSGIGQNGVRFSVDASEFPIKSQYLHLLDVIDADTLPALSLRATSGFQKRLLSGNLGRYPGFREDLVEHIAVLSDLNVRAIA